MSDKRIIVALDYADAGAAMALAERLDPTRCRVKVGKELFCRAGPPLVSRLVASGFDVFLDLKFHDIPNTVDGACRAAVDLGVWMLNVHAGGGRKMLDAARSAVPRGEALLIGVTVLTSLDSDDLAEVGVTGQAREQVLRLARLSESCGLDGVVCSPRETAALREHCRDDLLLVTPGIRPAGVEINDQSRIMTPAAAMRAGSDYLVIGRPITAAPEPMEAIAAIQLELDGSEL